MVSSDQLLSVEPDPSHPTGKAMCMKGRAAPEIVHSRHRVFYQMRRQPPNAHRALDGSVLVGEEALTETAQKLAAVREENQSNGRVVIQTFSGTLPLISKD